MKKGLNIEFKDSNGVDLSLGDRVRVERKIVLPNWDGWGRDVTQNTSASYQEKTHEGEIIYESCTCSFKVKLNNNLYFNLFMFDKIEKT